MSNGPSTDKSGQIVKKNGNGQGGDLASLIKVLTPEIARALPRHITPERMARVALTAVRMNPDLGSCSKASFAACLMSLAQLGLEPNTPLGLAYLIPRRSKDRGMESTLIIGYQGFIELARRSGLVTAIYAHVVREGDKFRYTLGLEQTVEHTPSDDPKRSERKITHVYAVARLRDAEPIFVVLTKAEVEARRKRSRASANGPWVTDEEAMTLKTAVRALWKWLPKSTEMSTAQIVDDAGDRGAVPVEAVEESQTMALAASGVFIPSVEQAEAAAESVVDFDPSLGEAPPEEVPA